MHLFKSALATAAIVFANTASAGMLYVSYDNFTYTGTVTRYATLADAQGSTNALSTTAISTATNGAQSTRPNARDGQVYVASNSPGYDSSSLAYFSTAWYYTLVPANSNGWGNPNNTNTGFVQYYDASVAPTVTGGWSNSNMTFTVNINGGNGDSIDAARLWAAPKVGGPSGDTAGTFVDFAFTMEANFLAAASYNNSTTWYETDANPDSMTGSATGIFQNLSTTDPSLNGFYAFDFSFATGSWAADQGAVWVGTTSTYEPSAFFAAPGAASVPEPATLGLLALAALGAWGARRRRA